MAWVLVGRWWGRGCGEVSLDVWVAKLELERWVVAVPKRRESDGVPVVSQSMMVSGGGKKEGGGLRSVPTADKCLRRSCAWLRVVSMRVLRRKIALTSCPQASCRRTEDAPCCLLTSGGLACKQWRPKKTYCLTGSLALEGLE